MKQTPILILSFLFACAAEVDPHPFASGEGDDGAQLDTGGTDEGNAEDSSGSAEDSEDATGSEGGQDPTSTGNATGEDTGSDSMNAESSSGGSTGEAPSCEDQREECIEAGYFEAMDCLDPFEGTDDHYCQDQIIIHTCINENAEISIACGMKFNCSDQSFEGAICYQECSIDYINCIQESGCVTSAELAPLDCLPNITACQSACNRIE